MYPVVSAPKGFIFSTAQHDKFPRVIIDLNLPGDHQGITIEIWNRDLPQCRDRVLGLQVCTSKDFREWRSHSIPADHPFVYEEVPLLLDLSPRERFLMFEIQDADNHFHLGGINVSASCDYGKSLNYDCGFYRFAQCFGSISNSQRLQDLFAIYNCGFGCGYFLEFGVADGSTLSNTLLLELLGWQGIVGEALQSFYQKAKATRNCVVIEGALASESGKEIEFFESGLISSSVMHSASDMYADRRSAGKRVKTLTKRIDEILLDSNAPRDIDYFSLDVEGAELEVLKTFPFDSYRLRCATIEHNHTAQEAEIDQIMESNGFKRVLRQISGHDGFYVSRDCNGIDWSQSGFALLKKDPTAAGILDFCRQELSC